MLISRQTYDLLVETFERAVLDEFKRFKYDPYTDPNVVPWVFGVAYTSTFRVIEYRKRGYPNSDFDELRYLYAPNGATIPWFKPTENLHAWVKQRFEAIDLSQIPLGKVVYLKEVA